MALAALVVATAVVAIVGSKSTSINLDEGRTLSQTESFGGEAASEAMVAPAPPRHAEAESGAAGGRASKETVFETELPSVKSSAGAAAGRDIERSDLPATCAGKVGRTA